MYVALTSTDDVISNSAPYLSHAASSDLSSAVPVTDGGDVEALALLFLLWLGTEPRICKTATKSASLSWRARFFQTRATLLSILQIFVDLLSLIFHCLLL
jgi:hypothetical protein